MKTILLIGKQAHRCTFIDRLNLEAGERLVIDGEEILLIERNPQTLHLAPSVSADYAICIGLHQDNDACLTHLHHIPSTVYFLEEKETPREFIEESLRFEKVIFSSNQEKDESDNAQSSPVSVEPISLLSRFGAFCHSITRASRQSEQEDGIEMTTMNVTKAGIK